MKKTIKEAGNYDNLTPQEKQLLASAAPEIRNSLASVVSSLRKRGKQIDLVQAAQQMQQVPHFANDPNLAKFVSLAGLQSTKVKQNPFQVQQNIPKPPQFMQQQAQQRAAMVPQQQGPTAGDQFEQLRTSNTNNDEVIAQQKAQQTQQQSSFDRAKQLRAQRDARMAQAGQAQPVNPLAATQMIQPPQQMTQKKKPVAEAINPAAMSGSLRNILASISKLKPEELSAIADMVNSLMNSKKGMGTTMESKKIVAEAIKVKLLEQVRARDTAQRLLSEGPVSSIWDKIKGAGSALAGGMGGIAGQMGKQAQQVGVDDNAKQAANELTKVLGKVNQYRQKFNSSILKNSEAMNAYHDLVLNAVQMYQQSQNFLGPFGQQIVRQIHDAVGNLVYDLKSEQEQIDSFLKQLKDAGMAKVGGASLANKQMSLDPTLLGAAAKKKAQASRVEENPGAISSARRSMPMGGGKMDPKYGDDLERSQALAKAKMGNMYGDQRTTQNAMNDLQKLYAKQIKREKDTKKKKSSGKK